ncbi:MAG: hypothetical protein ACK41D_10815 [Rubricoccaceae bacterium]
MPDAHLEPDLVAVALPPGTGPVAVRPVRTAADARRFQDFPYRLYAGHRFYVPPLRAEQAKTLSPKKNPFFEHGRMALFLAERGNHVVGRVAAIVNGRHLETHRDGAGFFGFFECVEDEDVAGALLNAAAGYLRAVGMKTMRGPTNPTLNDTAGLLVDGFLREPFILMPYNPPYYERLLTRHGLTRVMTMWAYYVHAANVDHARFKRGVDVVYRRHPDLRVRPLDRRRLGQEVAAAMRIYNAGWAGNWGHVPYTEAEAQHLAADLKQILDPDLFLFAELSGEPVAFSVSLPNVNAALRHVPDGRLFPLGLPRLLAHARFGAVHELRMPLMGVLPEHQGRAFDVPLIYETIRTGRRKGFDACEMSWVLETNTRLINALENLGAVRDKEYALFERAL